MPQLADPNFEQAVVLMVEHNEAGSMGLVINHRSEMTFRDLAQSQALSIAPSRLKDELYVGGPVEQYRGFVLHDRDAVDERLEVLPGLYLSVTSDVLPALLRDSQARLRFLLGYAGWAPGQIERELAAGSWLFTEATRRAVLELAAGDVWGAVIASMGLAPGWIVPSGGLN